MWSEHIKRAMTLRIYELKGEACLWSCMLIWASWRTVCCYYGLYCLWLAATLMQWIASCSFLSKHTVAVPSEWSRPVTAAAGRSTERELHNIQRLCFTQTCRCVFNWWHASWEAVFLPAVVTKNNCYKHVFFYILFFKNVLDFQQL